ncbi:MAG: hypothetical protein F6K50_37040, partial [Moorea sp. SIO3I7]|nr:hypothetical protein [Moorena sp. SIO3I7]
MNNIVDFQGHAHASFGERAVFTGHQDEVMDVAFSPYEQRLATASFDGTAK